MERSKGLGGRGKVRPEKVGDGRDRGKDNGGGEEMAVALPSYTIKTHTQTHVESLNTQNALSSTS